MEEKQWENVTETQGFIQAYFRGGGKSPPSDPKSPPSKNAEKVVTNLFWRPTPNIEILNQSSFCARVVLNTVSHGVTVTVSDCVAPITILWYHHAGPCKLVGLLHSTYTVMYCGL